MVRQPSVCGAAAAESGRDPGWFSPSVVHGRRRSGRLKGLTRPAEGSGPYEAPVDRTPVGRGPCAPPFCALSRRASDCIKCGKCEKACPQHLPIRQLLEQVSQEFDKAR
ncbi:MAG: 4Fe-4S binding protein [Oscillibacter sp.]|nr:4Fe-4S binding protein [Oscillibacter sp.]HAZ67030.1 hypothetical protein [Oscillibacter sp.]